SPDLSQLAIVASLGSSDGMLLLADTATGKEREVGELRNWTVLVKEEDEETSEEHEPIRVADPSVGPVVWSPDSSHLALSAGQPAETTLYVSDGSAVTPVARCPAPPGEVAQNTAIILFPDSSTVFFNCGTFK